MISPDCYLDTKNRISSRVKSNVFWWRFLLYITGQRYDRNSFIDGLSAAINNTIIYKSRPMVVCIRGEAIGSAPFTPGGPGAAAGTCTCYSPLLYYSIHQSIFFLFHRWWWAKGDADSIRHSGLWIAPFLYDIIGRQNVYPSSNQPFSPRSVVYIDTPIKLRICLGAIIHADWLWLPVVSYPICTAVCCLLCPIDTFGHTLSNWERDVMLRYSFNTKGRVRNRQVISWCAFLYFFFPPMFVSRWDHRHWWRRKWTWNFGCFFFFFSVNHAAPSAEERKTNEMMRWKPEHTSLIWIYRPICIPTIMYYWPSFEIKPQAIFRNRFDGGKTKNSNRFSYIRKVKREKLSSSIEIEIHSMIM